MKLKDIQRWQTVKVTPKPGDSFKEPFIGKVVAIHGFNVVQGAGLVVVENEDGDRFDCDTDQLSH